MQADQGKVQRSFALDAHLAFPDADDGLLRLDDFARFSETEVRNERFFEVPAGYDPVVTDVADGIQFPSALQTETEANDTVHVKVSEARNRAHALVVFHHWRADAYNGVVAGLLSRLGISVYEMALPYHLSRAVPGVADFNDFVSPNLGKTVRAIRQGVFDGGQVISILKRQGYGKISVMGTSLGSWVAGLVAAHDGSVQKAALLLAGGDAARAIWSARTTRHIKAVIDTELSLHDLERAWAVLNVENYVGKMARPNFEAKFILGNRDPAIIPEISRSLIDAMNDVGVTVDVSWLNCGHASLSRLPYSAMAAYQLVRFLRR